MSEMVERVKQAIIGALDGKNFRGCGHHACTCFFAEETFQCKLGITIDEVVRVAILAMREPTD